MVSLVRWSMKGGVKRDDDVFVATNQRMVMEARMEDGIMMDIHRGQDNNAS